MFLKSKVYIRDIFYDLENKTELYYEFDYESNYPQDNILRYAINLSNHKLISSRKVTKDDMQRALYQCHRNEDFSTFEFLSILKKKKEKILSPEDIVDYEIKDLACIVDKKYKFEEDNLCNTVLSTFLYHKFCPIVWYLLCCQNYKINFSVLKQILEFGEHNGDNKNAKKLYLKPKKAFFRK